MLQIVVPEFDGFDDETQTFISIKETTLTLEHSLISLSKWESKWHKPFLTDTDKTNEETIDYIRCMTITQNVRPEVYKCLTSKNFEDVDKYIQDKMTATWFSKSGKNGSGPRQIITSEVIYGWMVMFNIPFECEKWHINRLITLIRVCEINNNPKKKMPMNQVIRDNKALNEARKREMNTRG